MKDLFMCLLANLNNHGNVIEATMYKGGEMSTVKVETASGTYEVTIFKKDEVKE